MCLGPFGEDNWILIRVFFVELYSSVFNPNFFILSHHFLTDIHQEKLASCGLGQYFIINLVIV
jgi:hypothetical protein